MIIDNINIEYKYKKYKNRYLDIIQKGSSNSYRELYKKAVREADYPMGRENQKGSFKYL